MMVGEIQHGGMDVSFGADELQQLAVMMTEAAAIVKESPDWKEHPKGIVEQLEMLAAFFTVATVATGCQERMVPGKSVTYKRQTGTPVFTLPE